MKSLVKTTKKDKRVVPTEKAPMTPKSEEQFFNDINFRLTQTINQIKKFQKMSRARVYKTLGFDVKQKTFISAMDILRKEIDTTENKIIGEEKIMTIDVREWVKKLDETDTPSGQK